MLKYHRKHMQMTLEEGAEGICSISYLSKVENNLIECKKFYLDLLKVKYQVKETSHLEKDVESDLKIIEQHILYGGDLTIDLDEKYRDIQNHQSILIKYYHAMVHHKTKKASQYQRELFLMIAHLSHYELTLLCLVIAKFAYMHNKYQEGYEVISVLPIEKSPYRHLFLHIMRYRLLCAFKLKNENEIRMLYPKFRKEAIIQEAYQLHQEMQRQYLYYEAELIHPVDMAFKVETLDYLLPNEKEFILGLSLFHDQRYETALNHLSMVCHLDMDAMIVYMLTLDKLEHKELIIKLKDNMEFINQSNDAKVLYQHLICKYSDDKSDILHYLRTCILGVGMITHHYHILEYLMIDSQKLFAKYQYYKEATQVVQEIHPKLKSLKKAQQCLILET